MSISLTELLKRADARLGVRGMDADVARLTRDVIKEMHGQGIYICIAQGYRSIAEQNALYRIGRRGIPGEARVTNAPGGSSNHNYGVAVDLCIYPDTFLEVKFLQPSDSRMKKIVAAMKRRGFKWGGDWSGFPDYPHFELYNRVGGQKKPSLSGVPASPASSSVHIVRSGDTLSEISAKTGVSIANLKKYNKLKSSLIYVGQTLKLKSSSAATVKKPSVPKDIVQYPGKPLYVGAKGMSKKNIQRIQRALGFKDADGKFDAGVEVAVKRYQARKGLAADGVVGQSTWSMMF